jgi:hypothetical protein
VAGLVGAKPQLTPRQHGSSSAALTRSKACLHFVDCIVQNLIHQVMQTPLPCAANVHARTLAHRLQALQHLCRQQAGALAVCRLEWGSGSRPPEQAMPGLRLRTHCIPSCNPAPPAPSLSPPGFDQPHTSLTRPLPPLRPLSGGGAAALPAPAGNLHAACMVWRCRWLAARRCWHCKAWFPLGGTGRLGGEHRPAGPVPIAVSSPWR